MLSGILKDILEFLMLISIFRIVNKIIYLLPVVALRHPTEKNPNKLKQALNDIFHCFR